MLRAQLEEKARVERDDVLDLPCAEGTFDRELAEAVAVAIAGIKSA